MSPSRKNLKAKLSEQKGIWPKTSFIGHLRVPGVVSEDFETTYIAPDLRLAFQHTVSDLYSLSYNAGLFWDGENPEPLITYSLSNSFSILERLGIFAEVFGSTPQRESDDPELSVDAGLTYLIGNNFLLDVSAGTGLTDNVLERFISAGFSYRFKL